MKRGSIEQTLRSFGLTEKEAEVYIFLGKRGPLTCGAISKQIKMNKGLVHRKLKSLQKKGLVESTLEYPARFAAVQFEKIIDSYIKSKKEEVALIEEAKNDLLSDWKKIRREADSNIFAYYRLKRCRRSRKKNSDMMALFRHKRSSAYRNPIRRNVGV